MRLSSLLPLLIASLASAASWSFKDASLAVQELKGSELGAKKVYVTLWTFNGTFLTLEIAFRLRNYSLIPSLLVLLVV
jgi:hypothetical protein